ncbi:MAG TPA: GGDEF domain-containing protein [Usitatibacter sp.]|nr:GGDEF domain-containing protein [Usitatibacter sp.]
MAGPLQRDVLYMLGVEASDNLPGWLAERLRSQCPESSVRMLRVFPVGAARMKEKPAEAFSVSDSDDEQGVQPLRGDPFLVKALHDRACAEEKRSAGTRLVLPLHAGGEVRYAIELSSPSASPARPWLQGIAEIAQAYFERLASLETDPLTRLRTRRVFQTHVESGLRIWAHAKRRYYLAVLDIDRFKRINDEFGHLYGDEILVHFANVMRKSFRANDLLYRFGGEEFVLVHGADQGHTGRHALERFRAAVESYAFPGVGKVTVSIGYTRIADVSTPAAIFVDRADQAVYYAKANGRNQVHCYETLVEQGHIKATVADSKDVTLF